MSIAIQKTALCGGDLILSKKKVTPEKALHLSLIITDIAHKALSAFLRGEFAVFDAPVGDNSCKIRAVKIAQIAEHADREEIDHLLKELAGIIKRIGAFKLAKWNAGLREFRLETDLEFSLSNDLAFLIRSHFLFFVKKRGSYDQTDPEHLRRIAPITNSDAKDWIHLIKEQLAESSVHFVQEEASKLDIRGSILQKMLSERFIKVHEKRPILPNAPSMEVLFTFALKQGLYIAFKSPTETLLFHPNKSKTGLVLKNVEEADFNRPVVVVEGKIFSKLFFNKEDFFRLLLIRAIQDPQYLNGESSENIPFELHKEDLEVQHEMEHFERCRQIPTPFQIDHILCDKVENLFSRVPLPPEEPWHSCNWMGDDLNIRPGSW